MEDLKPGMAAPNFELKDADGKVWRLEDLRGQKVILYFYPADDTPGCTAQACGFRDSVDIWEKAGYVVLGVSPQGADSKRSFIDKYNLNFPLLIDEGRAVEKAYGTSREQAGDYQGIRLTTLRSTFVIDETGTIEQALYGVSARGHSEDLREKLGV